MKKILCVLTIIMLLLAGCESGGGKKAFSTWEDFEGATIGVVSGALYKDYVEALVQEAEYKEFNTLTEALEALSSNKVDAVPIDFPIAEYFTARNTDCVIFSELISGDKFGFAVAKDSPLTEKGNEALQKLIDNGTVDELKKMWSSTDDSIKALPELDYNENFDGSGGTIRYGFDGYIPPLNYIDSAGKPSGLELDIISRIAYELNMTVEFVQMDFNALFISLLSGKVDMVGGSISITGERREKMDFIGPYGEGSSVLVIKKDRMAK